MSIVVPLPGQLLFLLFRSTVWRPRLDGINVLPPRIPMRKVGQPYFPGVSLLLEPDFRPDSINENRNLP